jgi:hypothetical protein
MPSQKKTKAKKRSKWALSEQQQAQVDKAVRDVRGKAAVEATLKSSFNPKYAVYQFFGLSDGNVVNVLIGQEIKAHLMPETCKTVKDWRRRQARAVKRDEAKIAKPKFNVQN